MLAEVRASLRRASACARREADRAIGGERAGGEFQQVGGAVRSDREVHADFVHDTFSAFYPLAAASPVIAGLDLHHHGLSWTQAPSVVTHVLPDDRAAVLRFLESL